MPSNTESISSIHSLSVPLSVKNQTKEKFDALLKTAIQRKNGKSHHVSKEKLLKDLESTSASSENLLDKSTVDDINLKTLNAHSENYILNKFLNPQSNSDVKNDVSSIKPQSGNTVVVKPPVPKPRKKKCFSPTLSQGTFEVTSPKIVKNCFNHDKDADSPSSNKTYNLEEVLVHSSPKTPTVKQRKHLNQDNLDFAKDSVSKASQSDGEKKTSEDDEKISGIPQKRSIKKLFKDSSKNINKSRKATQEKDEEVNNKKRYYYEKIMEIIIHRSDRLQLGSLVIHPVVKIHVVDVITGKYFPKSDKERSVVFFYENNDNDYISPVMTHMYNLQEKRILYPSWEESILLNEDYEYCKDESNHLIMFFEILDFVPFGVLRKTSEKECAGGWHNIAFAFLKLRGKDGSLNIGKTIRLQLYYPYQTKKYNSQICNPWIWWKKKKLKKYPSTLQVTVKSVISPTVVAETFRSKTPIQGETSSSTKLCDEIHSKPIPELKLMGSSSNMNSNLNAESSNWRKIPNKPCGLPNKCLAKLNSYDHGCFVMKFCHSGIYLACAVEIENLFYIIVYSVLSLREVNKFSSHQALIYDIKWSSDDSFLLSASADNTISVFSLACAFFQILPHPAFVYCCDINIQKTIASGCYDGTIRIWNHVQKNSKADFHLFQELEGHNGYVTSLCFDKMSTIFSADSTGIIIEWCQEKDDWVLKRQILLLDLKETIINQILLFPKHRKLLVQSRDSVLRIIDLKSGCVLQWLSGGLNKRFQIFCSISSCGNFVFSGSENGFVHVWNSKNGQEIAAYIPFDSDHQFLTIHCVDFHPHDNILAISHYGKNFPILLYYLDEDIDQPAVNLVVKQEYYVENQMKQASRFKKIARSYNYVKGEAKLDFKGVLEKMDLVITSQKSQ